MMCYRFFKVCVFLAVSLGLSACVQMNNQAAFGDNPPLSILVIPPNNLSTSVNAPYIYLSTLSRPLAERGYYVFPVAVIDQFLKENGLPTPAEMNSVPLDKLQKYTGADAVLYSEIESWGQVFQVVQSKTVVSVRLRLVDARSGLELWQTRVQGERIPENRGGNNLLGAIVSAVADQIVGSTIDYTPELAREANNRSLGALPEGHYRLERSQ